MNADVMTTLPTPLTDAVRYDTGLRAFAWDTEDWVVPAGHAEQLERDAMTMALRIYGEDPDTFSPETRECMNRWRPRVEALLTKHTGKL